MVESTHRSIEIPLHSGEEVSLSYPIARVFLSYCSFLIKVIEVSLDQLPDGQEALAILQQESCPLHIWVTLAVSECPTAKEIEHLSISVGILSTR